MRKSAELLPLTSATVTVNGSNYGRRDLIWAGLRWTEGTIYDHPGNHFLSVPWCHPINAVPSHDCGWYRVRPRDERYRFEFARNGLFVLRLAASEAPVAVQPQGRPNRTGETPNRPSGPPRRRAGVTGDER